MDPLGIDGNSVVSVKETSAALGSEEVFRIPATAEEIVVVQLNVLLRQSRNRPQKLLDDLWFDFVVVVIIIFFSTHTQIQIQR